MRSEYCDSDEQEALTVGLKLDRENFELAEDIHLRLSIAILCI